ncbi:MAG: hypothetical protein ACTHU0_29955 [Kofleriaceae bacterium]
MIPSTCSPVPLVERCLAAPVLPTTEPLNQLKPWRCHPDLNWGMVVLQTFAFPVTALSLLAAREALSGAFGVTTKNKASNVIVRSKGAKRDQDQLEAIRTKLTKTIEANPGKRIEEIGKASDYQPRSWRCRCVSCSRPR